MTLLQDSSSESISRGLGGNLYWLALASVLALSSFVSFQNLGSPHITWWDEAEHVNVVENLAERCCLPQLHHTDGVPIDYRDWTNNGLWLHKPRLPFYVSAVSYRFLGGSLWAFRLPGAIFALLTAVVIFFTGQKFLNRQAAILGAAVYGLNPFTNELVHGRIYSGTPDLALAFFLSIAIYLLLDWQQNRSMASLRWFGVVLGLAYLTKGGLALPPFVVLFGMEILQRGIRATIPLLQSLLTFVVVAVPERLYWQLHYPTEFRYEEHLQLAHLFTVVEGHSGNFLAYLVGQLTGILTPSMVFFAYAALAWALVRFRPGTSAATLSLWTLVYLVPLSLAVSKIQNFIFPVIPALVLLTPYGIETLLKAQKFALLLSLSVTSLAAHGVTYATRTFEHQNSWDFLGITIVFLLVHGLIVALKYESPRVATTCLGLALAGLVLAYPLQDIQANTAEPEGGARQAEVRKVGSDLRSVVGRDGVILTHRNTPQRAYLFLMYWADADVFDSCDPSGFRTQKRLYLLTEGTLRAPVLYRSAMGNLYSLDGVPYEEWAPVAAGACK